MPESNGENPTQSPATLRDKFRFAFGVGPEYEEKLEDDEEKLLSDIACNIHKRRMDSVAIPLLLLNKPLNVIGANLVQMGEVALTMGPVETFLRKFLGPSYTHELFVRTLEKRISIEKLVENLEALAD